MYIIELIAKTIINKRLKKNNVLEKSQDEDETCDHVYYVIDSSAEYLACSKCGNVIKNTKKNIKKNIFKV